MPLKSDKFVPSSPDDEFYMELALKQARIARESGDVPVGAVLVCQGVVIVHAHNRTFAGNDPTGHAEIVALKKGALVQQSPRLTDCTLYVTLEPCCMCVGALVHARISRLVYAAPEPKTGAVSSAFELATHERHNHRFEITSGVLADESIVLLQDFFKSRRLELKSDRVKNQAHKINQGKIN